MAILTDWLVAAGRLTRAERMQRTLIGRINRLRRAGTLGLAIKGEIGDWVARLGGRLGSESITYNPWTFAVFHRAALETAPTVIGGILELYPQLRTAVDIGSGTGVYVHQLRQRGLEADGFEYFPRARRIARDLMGVETHPFDLETLTLQRRYDLALCLEVAEHVPPALGERLVDLCAAAAPVVVFSAAHPGQPGQGHIHLQPKTYWIDRFRERGLSEQPDKTGWLERYLRANLERGFWLADNIGVYEAVHVRGRPA